MRVRRQANLAIGKHQAANQVIGNQPFDHLPERLLDQGLPRPFPVAVQAAAHFFPAHQRLSQARPNDRGQLLLHFLKLQKSPVIALIPGQCEEGFPIAIGGVVEEQQFAQLPIVESGRPRCRTARFQPEIQVKVVNDLSRKEADQIGIDGELGIHPFEDAG